MIWLTFQRGRLQPSGIVRIFGLAAAPFSDLSGWFGEGSLPRFQKEHKIQVDNRSALHAGLICAHGMQCALLSANENKSGSGETNIMIYLRKRS